MLDPKAAVARAVVAFGVLEHTEDDVVCLVTDRVNGNLQSGTVRIEDVLPHFALGDHLVAGQAARRRRVEIGIEEERGGGTEGTVRKAFQSSDVQVAAAERG